MDSWDCTINCIPYHDERPEGLYSFLPGCYQKPTLIKKNCDNQNPCMRGISSSNLWQKALHQHTQL
jgi:hypothetical protein